MTIPTLLPVSTFKDAVHLSPNDDYYLVTDSEGNIVRKVIKILIFILDLTIILISFSSKHLPN
jgi:hypothetical protein